MTEDTDDENPEPNPNPEQTQVKDAIAKLQRRSDDDAAKPAAIKGAVSLDPSALMDVIGELERLGEIYSTDAGYKLVESRPAETESDDTEEATEDSDGSEEKEKEKEETTEGGSVGSIDDHPPEVTADGGPGQQRSKSAEETETESDGVTFSATEFTVSASEKISTGDYENYEPFASITGEIDGVEELDDQTRLMIKGRLLELHKDLQKTLGQAANNRLSIADDEDWTVRDD